MTDQPDVCVWTRYIEYSRNGYIYWLDTACGHTVYLSDDSDICIHCKRKIKIIDGKRLVVEAEE